MRPQRYEKIGEKRVGKRIFLHSAGFYGRRCCMSNLSKCKLFLGIAYLLSNFAEPKNGENNACFAKAAYCFGQSITNILVKIYCHFGRSTCLFLPNKQGGLGRVFACVCRIGSAYSLFSLENMHRTRWSTIKSPRLTHIFLAGQKCQPASFGRF